MLLFLSRYILSISPSPMLNHSTTATETNGWSRGYGYDEWGNMYVGTSNGGPAPNVNTAISQNQ